MLNKSFSLQQRQFAVERAWYELFPPPEPVYVESSRSNDPFIIEVLDDSIVIYKDDKYYRASYSMSGEKAQIVPQSEWVEVESKQEWVAAGKMRMKVLQNPLDATLIAYGGAVKALGNGKIGGYLVRFTTHRDPDLEGEFFTKETDFGEAGAAPVYYQHGMDYKLGRRRLGKASHKMDDFGIWAEAQLDLRDEYEEFIYEMIEKGKMGWSSGTAGHLVEREPKGKSTWIASWPLGLDDTLTPTPAEPRNAAIPLKSWKPGEIRWTLVERIDTINAELKDLSGDVRALIEKVDRPLSEAKRKELTELLESCSGMDAVRSDLQSVLASAPIPTKLVEAHMIRRQLAELRKRQPDLLAGAPAKE